MISKVFRLLAWWIVSLTCLTSTKAQLFQLSTKTSPDLATTNDVISYQFAITNYTGGFLSNFQLNVSFSEEVEFVSATNVFGTFEVVGSNVVYQVTSLTPGQGIQMYLQIQPVRSGTLTTYLKYFTRDIFPPDQQIEKVIFSAAADLGVSLLSPTNTLVAGDWITYRLTVTNRGPDHVDAVVVTTEWPPDTDFIAISPLISSSVTADEMVFSTPQIQAGTNRFYDITIQPNQPGQGLLTGSLYVKDLLDPNPANNKTTNTLSLARAAAESLTVSFVSGQVFNPQTGLMEQTIRLTNNGTTNVPTSRVAISDFSYRVVNAAGTNNNVPYVTLTRPLEPAATADLLLEYFLPSRTPVANPVMTGYSVPVLVPGAPSGNSMKINGIYALTAGNMLIEFVTEPGKSYSIIYSDKVTFTNAVRALPAVNATANRVQWIDAGPPKTSWKPVETHQRFYQVIEIPD